MEPVALLFPGQGAQFVGMGKNLLDFPQAEAIFEEADAILPECGLSRLCFDGPEEDLRLTLNAQPAIFTVGIASYEVFKRMWGTEQVQFAAGHSVGEYGALVAAGVLTFPDALRLVRRRGELMYQAGLSRPGTMAAILGMHALEVESICTESSGEKIVELANLNTPTQVVVSGDPEAVEKAGALAKSRGAKRVIPLSVSGAFHSKLMEEAASALSKELDVVAFRDAQFPIVANATAKSISNGKEIRELLKRQIRDKVMWESSIRTILDSGVSTFVEMEPGNVLCGLVRSIDKGARTLRFEQIKQRSAISKNYMASSKHEELNAEC